MPVAVLLARGLLQLREALEAERLREAHDRRGRRVRAARELLGRVEGDLVEVVDDVLRDVLLRARELVEARRDVGGQRLVALRGGRHRNGSRHGPTWFRRTGRPIPSTLRAPMQRIATRLPGLVLLAPAVHGDARGFFVETFRADAWAAEGVPTEFVQDNHSRSRRGTLRGLHFQTHPGQGKLVRVARGPRARRRRRPAPRLPHVRRVGGRRARRRARAPALHPGRLRPRLLRALRDRGLRLQVHELLRRRRPRPGSASTTPTSGVEWPAGRRAALLRARPRRRRGSPTSPTRCRSATTDERRTGASRRARPGTLHLGNLRTALLAWLFARTRRARASSCGWRTSTRAACRPARPSASCATCARSGSTGTARSSSSPTATTPTRPRSSSSGRPATVYECFCTRAEIRAAASAPHGPLPEGAYPGTCLRLTEAERRRKRAGGRPPALRVRAAAARVGVHRPRPRRRRRAWSTTSSCAATTARPPTTSR